MGLRHTRSHSVPRVQVPSQPESKTVFPWYEKRHGLGTGQSDRYGHVADLLFTSLYTLLRDLRRRLDCRIRQRLATGCSFPICHADW